MLAASLLQRMWAGRVRKREQIERELKETDAIVAENKGWRRGIGSSIRVGVESAVNQAPDIEAIVLLTCDQPFLKTDTIERLIATREKTKICSIASVFRNCSLWTMRPARRRSFYQIGNESRNFFFPKERSTSTQRRITKS
jgi:CTP:molybdopterin cytidylyltransferase MocA